MTTPTKEARRQKPIPDSWHDLIIGMYDLRPIKNKKTHDRALQVLRILMRVLNRSKDQNDYLKSLSALIGDYEARACVIDVEHDPIENLRFLLEENDMTASDLGRLLGDRSLGTRVLKGDRALSKSHIKKLSERFRVSPAVFI